MPSGTLAPMTGILDLLLPASCAACGALGAPCCETCRRAWGNPTPVARAPCAGLKVFALAPYAETARKLVLAYKEKGRRDLAAPLGALLAAAIPYLPGVTPHEGVWWLVPAPSRRVAARVRGGPHMLRLAKACARMLPHARVLPVLALDSAVRDAVGLTRGQRMRNLDGRIRTVAPPPSGTSVLLLDDVVTTGATAAACADALRRANCSVSAVLSLTATR